MSHVPFVDGSPAAAPYFGTLIVGTTSFLLCVWVGLMIRRKFTVRSLLRPKSKGTVFEEDDILGPLTWVLLNNSNTRRKLFGA